jgi:undecaprenyl-diphosphatase
MKFLASANRFIRTSATVRIALGFLIAACLLLLIGWLVTGPARSYAAAFDGSIRSSIRQMHSPLWTSLFLTVTKFGSTVYLIIAGSIAGIAFIYLRWFRPLWLFIVAMAGQAILHNGAKLLIARGRPSAMLSYQPVESFSFPSGHALSSLCLYATVVWLITNRLENSAIKAALWIVTAIFVLLIGLSRLYIGIHFPTDVLAGWLAAAIWTAAVVSTDRKPL